MFPCRLGVAASRTAQVDIVDNAAGGSGLGALTSRGAGASPPFNVMQKNYSGGLLLV